MTANDAEQPKPLIGKKGDYTFEMWVEVEGKRLEIYGMTEADDGRLEGWVVSEIGKSFEVFAQITDTLKWRFEYPDMRTVCKVDGAIIKEVMFREAAMRPFENGPKAVSRFAQQRISQTKVQKLQFAKPVLTEEATSEEAMQGLGSLELEFSRCEGTRSLTTLLAKLSIPHGRRLRFKDPEYSPVTNHTFYTVRMHPRDATGGYLKMPLRYASRDLIQALGHIPLDINIKPGEAGLQAETPIVFDDEEPEAGPSRNVRAKAGKVKKEVGTGESVDQIADEIAEAQKALEELRERKRAALAKENARRADQVDSDDDDKENLV